MSDYFSKIEPMDIEGEAVCAVGSQSVMAEGEKAGDKVKRTSSHPEADNLIRDPLLDMGEGVLDFLWVQFPRAHGGGAKPTCSANTGPRPMKQHH